MGVRGNKSISSTAEVLRSMDDEEARLSCSMVISLLINGSDWFRDDSKASRRLR